MMELKDVTKRFGSTLAVDRLSLMIPNGKIVAILGPNGSGKSTLLRLLIGLLKPDSGTLFLDGIEYKWGDIQLRKKIAYLPQTLAFPNAATGHELLDLYAELLHVDNKSTLQNLQKIFPAGFLDKSVHEYSTGMLQQIGLAIVSLERTPILLLDEPTASLDPAATRQLRDSIRAEAASGRTVLFTTHDLADVESIADKVVLLSDGKIVATELVSVLRERAENNPAHIVSLLPELESLYRSHIGMEKPK